MATNTKLPAIPPVRSTGSFSIRRRETMRKWRSALRLNRTDFAILLQLGSERIASYESGRVPWPDRIYAAAIATVRQDAQQLKTHLSELLNGEVSHER